MAGVDEAGRGPLAGPVVAAAAILPAQWAEAGLPANSAVSTIPSNSPPMQREKFFAFLTACDEVEYAIAQIDSVSD